MNSSFALSLTFNEKYPFLISYREIILLCMKLFTSVSSGNDIAGVDFNILFNVVRSARILTGMSSLLILSDLFSMFWSALVHCLREEPEGFFGTVRRLCTYLLVD